MRIASFPYVFTTLYLSRGKTSTSFYLGTMSATSPPVLRITSAAYMGFHSGWHVV